MRGRRPRPPWISREQVIERVEASRPKYNRLYSHPLEWTWSSQKLRQWFAKHKPRIPCTASDQVHSLRQPSQVCEPGVGNGQVLKGEPSQFWHTIK